MRLEVYVQMGGESLSPDATGALELIRILRVLADDSERDAVLLEVGDHVELRDANDQAVGHAALVPDWTVGMHVWVTATEGSLVEAVVEEVEPFGGFWTVTTRQRWINALLSPVLVDHNGHDPNGKPRLGRKR